MFDLELVAQLYALQTDPAATQEQQSEARDKIAAIADEVVGQYLATLVSDKTGLPKFDCYGALYCRTLIGANCSGNVLGVPDEGDKVGTVLLHRKYTSSVVDF
jgi:hypothetical protein